MFWNKKKKKEPQEIEDLNYWIKKTYESLLFVQDIQDITLPQLQEDFKTQKGFILVQTRGKHQDSPFMFLMGKDFMDTHAIPFEKLNAGKIINWANAITPLIWLQPNSEDPQEYELPFYYLDPQRGGPEDLISLAWIASPMKILKCSETNSGCIYLFIDPSLYKQLQYRLLNNEIFCKSAKAFLFDEEFKNSQRTDIPDPMVIKIDEPEGFMAGRFFIPLNLARGRDPLSSVITSVVLSSSGQYFSDMPGLWYHLSLSSEEGTQWPLLYHFVQPPERKQDLDPQVFQPLMKKLIKGLGKSFKLSGLELLKLQGQFCAEPPDSLISKCYILNFRILAGSYILGAAMAVPHGLVQRLVKTLAFPWTITLSLSNPLNLLRMLFSLDHLVLQRNKVPLLPQSEMQMDPGKVQSLEELRRGFISFQDLFSLSSPWETTYLVTNFLYRQGWTGATLPKLFYYIEFQENQGKTTASRFCLLGFQERRLVDAMPKNMADQWPPHGLSPDNLWSYNDWCQENFQQQKLLLKALNHGDIQLSFRLEQLLRQEFERYRGSVEEYRLQHFQEDKEHLQKGGLKDEELRYFFYHLDARRGAMLFYFVPEQMNYYGKLIPPAKRERLEYQIEQLKKYPEDEDEYLITAVELRREILNAFQQALEII